MSSAGTRHNWSGRGVVSMLLLAMSLMAGCGPTISRDDRPTEEEPPEESPEPTPTPTPTPSPTPPPHRCGPTRAKVNYVVDGDTVVLEGGKRVRYLMVDTPETTNGHNDCYGQEATTFNRNLVLGQEVTLRYDEECTDQYGRLLAYITVGGVEVNTKLLEGGYACVLHVKPNGDDRLQEFLGIQKTARNKKVGMWGKCTSFPCW